MRSPVIAFGLFAAATVSPALVGAAPTPPTPNVPTTVPANVPPHTHVVRAFDSGTAGGNAYTGGTSDTSGGQVVNNGDDGEDDTLTNATANTGGLAGASNSGDATGGDGRDRGPGGNANTGNTGNANGGGVSNSGGTINNSAQSNIGGQGNTSDSGDATGGDAKKKRAVDQQTAGGNAYSGASGNTSSGSIVNSADGDGTTVTNTGPDTNFGDAAGTSTTGDAEGGQGNGRGPGGNAYSGFSGPAQGGSVYNEGGSIGNTAVANAAGNGNDSTSGNADGGDA